jgi:hypothetical protein
MNNIVRVAIGGFLLGMIMQMSGCVVAEPREGYYDRDHHRWYHEHTWRDCHEHDEHCG